MGVTIVGEKQRYITAVKSDENVPETWQPISRQCSISIPPENRKTWVFWRF